MATIPGRPVLPRTRRQHRPANSREREKPLAVQSSLMNRYQRHAASKCEILHVVDASHNSGSITRFPELSFYLPVVFFILLPLENSIVGNLWTSAL